MPVTTHPLSQTAADLLDLAIARLGVAPASTWMFTGLAALGGRSPIQAIKAGRLEDVKRVLLDLHKETP